MALTPEDVVNKRFNPTKFREGYDQDEVDDFLDEVVVELRRLTQENEELRQRLVQSESRINELQRGGGDAAPAPAAAEPVPAVVPEPVAAPVPAAAPVADDSAGVTESTNNLLQLARRLHEEHVREGIEKRDALIAEGHATAARLVSEAETSSREQVERLETTKARLEGSISELQSFESEYRGKLKGYIEDQLRELEQSASFGEGAPEVATAPQAPASPAAASIAPPPSSAAAAPSAGFPGSAPAPVQAAPGSASAPASAAAPGSASAPASAAVPPSAPAPVQSFGSAPAPQFPTPSSPFGTPLQPSSAQQAPSAPDQSGLGGR
ncbi:DivIVA domain-containing protein [Homoserinibacter sp. YIM 151385]|uniref:DivIVA domain-containing protein n=1 Tax=Homoserinibacter sp. YIM 151385 TaxID=2985506 RepID=UPI002FDDC194